MGDCLLRKKQKPTFATPYEQVVNYTMLYDHGDECTDVTGGWEIDVLINNGGATASKYESYIELTGKGNSSSGSSTIAHIANPIDVSDYSALVGVYTTTGFFTDGRYHSGWKHGLTLDYNELENYIVEGYSTENLSNKTYVLPVSYLGSAYITLFNRSGYSPSFPNTSIKIYTSMLVKPDDYTTLCTKAGISAPSDLATLLADTTKLTEIFNNQEAITYMVYNCTGDFMASIVSNNTALGLLQNSPYYNTVLANEHWAKFLAIVA